MPTKCPDFLLQHVHSAQAGPSRPHITVTWAQSLDFKIAGPSGRRVILSGPESMEMTHWLRSMHDSILIGINTLLLDDPRLKSALPPPLTPGSARPFKSRLTADKKAVQLLPPDNPTLLPPQPLILDPQLRFPSTARILSEWTSHRSSNPSRSGPGLVRQPWILCGDAVDPDRIRSVEQAGAAVVPVPLDTEGRIPPGALPSILGRLGLGSCMIEGGSRVLSSFLSAGPREDGSPLVDTVVVTVAPMFIGEGIPVVPAEDEARLPALLTLYTETMGKDSVMICAPDQLL